MDVDAPRRRFITRVEVEDAARSGQTVALGKRDVLTDEAAQRARDLGVTIARSSELAQERTSASQRSPEDSARPDPDLRTVVRAAVIAEIGDEPAGLEAALNKVFGF